MLRVARRKEGPERERKEGSRRGKRQKRWVAPSVLHVAHAIKAQKEEEEHLPGRP